MSGIWHPFTQEKTAPKPLKVKSGKGAVIELEDGTELIDGIASWWVNIHGHGRVEIARAIAEQAKQLEQVIFAGFTHGPAENLVVELLKLLPDYFEKAFFSDNGSTSVEVALKMALAYHHHKKQKKIKFLAFKGAYHGDTFGAMSVAERGPFSEAFNSLLFDVDFITPPIRNNSDLIYQSHSELDRKLEKVDQYAGFIFEPIVQGASGMVMQDIGELDIQLEKCKSKGVLLIADEVMTGFGRTGKMFATDYLKTPVDIICLSKAITGGFLPLGVTVSNAKIYNEFYSEDESRAFYHGHSYTANPVACRAALASLKILNQQTSINDRNRIANKHRLFAEKLKSNFENYVEQVRVQGTILAFDMRVAGESGYFNPIRKRCYSFFLEHGVLLRPLGNTLYVLPPYVTSNEQLDTIYQTIELFLNSLGPEV